MAMSASRPHLSAALISTCWAGVCGCCRCDVEFACNDVGFGFGVGLLGCVFPLWFGLVVLGSPGARPFDVYGGGALVGTAVLATVPEACVANCESEPDVGGGTPGGAVGCVLWPF
jgi:hypothetical protein